MADKYEDLPEAPTASTSRPQPKTKQQPFQDFSEDEDEDDDPVVRRLPVYYTPQYLQSLCLLQYPDKLPHPDSAHPLLPPGLRPDWANNKDPAVGKLQTKFKPNSQHLEVTIPMEKHPERWNEDNAKAFAAGVVEERDKEREKAQEKRRGRKKNVDEDEEARYREDKEQRRLDKMVFASTGVPEVTSYLIGVVKNGAFSFLSLLKCSLTPSHSVDALHLNPVNQTFQLRPSLTYLDNILAIERRAKRAAQANDEDDDEELSDTELKKEEAKAVQVSIKQTGEGAQGKGPLGGGNGRGGVGLFAPMRAEEAESWKPLEHYHSNVRSSLSSSFLPKTDFSFRRPSWRAKRSSVSSHRQTRR